MLSKHFLARFIVLAFLALTISCKVTLVAPQDAALIVQIDKTGEEIDAFYLRMLEQSERPYVQYAEKYIDIEVRLNSIYNKSRLKPKNEQATRIAQIIKETWEKYKAEHKLANALNDTEIKYNKDSMADKLFTLSVAERTKPE